MALQAQSCPNYLKKNVKNELFFFLFHSLVQYFVSVLVSNKHVLDFRCKEWLLQCKLYCQVNSNDWMVNYCCSQQFELSELTFMYLETLWWDFFFPLNMFQQQQEKV